MLHSLCNITHALSGWLIHGSYLRLERKSLIKWFGLFHTILFMSKKSLLVGQHPDRWGAPSGGGWGGGWGEFLQYGKSMVYGKRNPYNIFKI